MKRSSCCTRRTTGLAGTLLSGIPLLLMPKCPLCVAAHVTLLTGISVSTTTAGHLRTGILSLSLSLLCVCTAVCLLRMKGWRRKER